MHHKLAIVTIAVLAAASGTVPAAAQIVPQRSPSAP